MTAYGYKRPTAQSHLPWSLYFSTLVFAQKPSMKISIKILVLLCAACLLNESLQAADTLRLSQLQAEGYIHLQKLTEVLEAPPGIAAHRVKTNNFPQAQKAETGHEYWYNLVLLNNLPENFRGAFVFKESGLLNRSVLLHHLQSPKSHW